MKPFKAIEATRKNYHQWPARNSVHRAAAIFPIFDRAHYANNLTFLNHWLIKRGIPEIGARHTLRDETGARVGQVYSVVDRHKAYSVDLEEVMQAAGLEEGLQTGSWEVEFFSARNMFIPYPAVVQTVYNDSFLNQVHAYARVLNDFEEDRSVNQVKVDEASVDVALGEGYDTFVTVINGPMRTEDRLRFRLVDQQGGEEVREIPFEADPFEVRTLMLSEVFGPEIGVVACDRTLFVSQPDMRMFYNRLFAGVVRTAGDRPLAANHSYYDNSGFAEYFDVDPAHERQANMSLALVEGLPLTLRFYPILSPAALDFHIAYYDAAGERIALKERVASWPAQKTARIMEIDVDALKPGPEAASADLFVTAADGKTPTRLTLQVCYGAKGALGSSINLSMNSPYVFVPENKVGLNWMAVTGHPEVDNSIAVCHSSPVPDEDVRTVAITLYRDEDEETMTGALDLKGHAGFGGDLDRVLPGYKDFLGGRNGFLYLESESPFLRSISLQTNRTTGHTSGEHSF